MSKTLRHILFPATWLMLVGLSGCATQMQSEPDNAMQYPESPRENQVDVYHGVTVADPYRWLENTSSLQTNQWIQQQNALSMPWLTEQPSYDSFKSRLTSLWNYQKVGTPFRHGERYFQFRNDGLQDQDVLYVSDQLNGQQRVLLDPNGLSTDGTVSLARVAVSPKANFLAYAVSDGGSDWVRWHLRDITSGQELDFQLEGTKFTNLAWVPDESGFYYSRYPKRPNGDGFDDNQPVAIYYHQLGSPVTSDQKVYDVSDQNSRWNPYPTVSSDGRFLIATVRDGFASNAIHYLNRLRPQQGWQPLLADWDARYQFIASDGNLLYLQTNNQASTGRVIAVDINRPSAEHWEEVIAARPATLTDISYVGGRFFASYLENASSKVRVYDARGNFTNDIDLPGIGTVSGFTGDSMQLETFFSFSSFTEAGRVMRYDIPTARVTELERIEIATDLSDYRTEQVYYTSDDGTEIPMFLISRGELQRDGKQPTLLYGYGGFNIALTPTFSPARLAWLERGGVIAIANLRGGGEFGTDWHQAGTKQNKQNVFDDFIAAAEYLIDTDITQSAQLAIQGASNGGLLVGAAMTQRPELFAAALPAVGVLDMLRYHLPSANARAWQSDFGISENPEEFAALLDYSPVHNVVENRCYPATLITTGDHDDRVVPWHSYKFAAALQSAQSCEAPILLRVETRAGHGAGTPTWMRIEQVAEQWAFLWQQFGLAADDDAVVSN